MDDETHRSRHLTAVILTIGAIACRAAFSQPEPSAASHDPVRATVAKVEEIQSLEGVDSPSLIEPLWALAVFYPSPLTAEEPVGGRSRRSRSRRRNAVLASERFAVVARAAQPASSFADASN